MGFKANFCCFCCCAMKPKKFTRAVAILFLVLSIVFCILSGVNASRVSGAYMATPIIQIILAAATVIFSIVVLIMIGKGNWGLVKGYGIFCLIVNIISLLMTVASLVLYLFAVGVVGSAVSDATNNSDVTSAVVGFALVIAIVPYTITFLVHAWFIHLSYKVWKGADKMEEKEEEKAEKKKKKKEEEEQYNQYSNNPNQNQAYYPPPQNPGYQPAENKPMNNVQNDYQA